MSKDKIESDNALLRNQDPEKHAHQLQLEMLAPAMGGSMVGKVQVC